MYLRRDFPCRMTDASHQSSCCSRLGCGNGTSFGPLFTICSGVCFRAFAIPCSFHTSLSHSHWYRICRALQIAFLDSDDVWLPEKTEIQVRCMTPECGVIHCNRFNPIEFGNLWHRQAHVSPRGALVRRQALFEVEGFEECRAVISVEDLNVWLKIALTDSRFLERWRTCLFTVQLRTAFQRTNLGWPRQS